MSYRAHYATQSPVTDPGRFASRLAAVSGTVPAIAAATRELVFHYRSGGDWAENGIDADRITEIDTRYAEDMLARLDELADLPLGQARKPRERLVGCCRDFTVLFLSVARHHGVPARARVGFAAYFEPGWFVDHVVAEVWDDAHNRWGYVDSELADDYIDPADGAPVDPHDVPSAKFLTGPQAWLACQAGTLDVEKFVVDPGLDIPATRGWPQVHHNLVHDLASLAKHEMVLWDSWGLLDVDGEPTPDDLALLEKLATTTCSTDVEADQLRSFWEREELRVPAVVTSYSAACDVPLEVNVERSL